MPSPNSTGKSPPANALYGWYYITYAMFQHGGKPWKAWKNKFQDVLKKNQHPDGYWEYPGHYHGKSGDDITDKVHATVFSCLMLEVFYRFAPSMSNAAGHKASKAAVKKADMEEEVDIFE